MCAYQSEENHIVRPVQLRTFQTTRINSQPDSNDGKYRENHAHDDERDCLVGKHDRVRGGRVRVASTRMDSSNEYMPPPRDSSRMVPNVRIRVSKTKCRDLECGGAKSPEHA